MPTSPFHHAYHSPVPQCDDTISHPRAISLPVLLALGAVPGQPKVPNPQYPSIVDEEVAVLQVPM